ncbi:MAG TPA: site-2 protease family protein [Candidatus Elarobacter sp.]|jgi:Zn-dependent protease|nr:site-2 protease family protein [Candidatus Elarobacter sp.]
MHDDERPHEPKQRRGPAGAIGGILVALGLAAAKLKALLAVLFSIKWLFIAPKLLFSFGSMFLSVWIYAQWFGGWKIAIVFVLMILVHELGHYLTWRNYGVKAALPLFIPGFGAFVSAPATGTPAQNVAASLAGPAFGIAAAAVCWGYAFFLGEPSLAPQMRFWTGCAYIGLFINLFNLIPTPPFDGGAIAGAIDGRLWIIGIALLGGWILFFGHSIFAIVILVLMLVTAVPRVIAMFRGELDPRGSGLLPVQRGLTFAAYIALVLIAVAGAAATYVERGA